MTIKYLGLDVGGPEGMKDNPYVPETKRWHMLVDFACMPTTKFTIKDVAKYHAQESSYYNIDNLKILEEDGFIKFLTNDWGI